MDDALNTWIFLENAFEGWHITTVYLLESRTDACDFLNTIQHLDIRVGEIVDNDYFVACLLQLYSGTATNKTGSTSH